MTNKAHNFNPLIELVQIMHNVLISDNVQWVIREILGNFRKSVQTGQTHKPTSGKKSK